MATCDYYADFMADYLDVARDKVHVVPTRASTPTGTTVLKPEPRRDAPFVVGYLARDLPGERGCTTWSRRSTCW